MVLDFDNAEEFATEFEEKVLDVESYILTLTDYIGVKLNEPVRNRLARMQKKRNADRERYEEWLAQMKGREFSEDDFPADVVASVESATGKTMRTVCEGHVNAEVTPDHTFFKKMVRYRGKYRFNEDGFLFFMFYFAYHNMITMQRYLEWEKEIGIRTET